MKPSELIRQGCMDFTVCIKTAAGTYGYYNVRSMWVDDPSNAGQKRKVFTDIPVDARIADNPTVIAWNAVTGRTQPEAIGFLERLGL
jgi:hypothetical protein